MTSNERKIINCLRETKEKMHIRLVAQKTNFSSDYARILCRSLARAGYIKFEDSNICCLLKKGHGNFENAGAVAEKSEPVIATANVTLLTDEPAVVSPASDQSDEEENQEESASEDKNQNKPASSDEELDRALSDLEHSLQKDESEEKDKSEESKDETELKPELKVEEEKPAVAEAMMGKEKELTEEAKAENPEKAVLKKEPVRSSGGFGASLKKFINWFAEKK